MTNNAEIKIIRLEGNIRSGEATDDLRARVEDHLGKGCSRIVINMEKVSTLDSTGIGVLVRSLTLCKEKGGGVKLVAVPKNAIQTLHITGILKLFERFDSDAAATKSFQA